METKKLLEPYMISSDKFQIVPDRWSATGWKYLAGDQITKKKFFNNPNRMSSQGIMSPSKMAKLQQQMHLGQYANEYDYQQPNTRES